MTKCPKDNIKYLMELNNEDHNESSFPLRVLIPENFFLLFLDHHRGGVTIAVNGLVT